MGELASTPPRTSPPPELARPTTATMCCSGSTTTSLKTEGWWQAAQSAVEQCTKYLVKHRVTKVEVTYQQPGSKKGDRQEIIRLVYMNETGAIPEICVYRVDENVSVGGGVEMGGVDF